jgi:hypothetical protein
MTGSDTPERVSCRFSSIPHLPFRLSVQDDALRIMQGSDP